MFCLHQLGVVHKRQKKRCLYLFQKRVSNDSARDKPIGVNEYPAALVEDCGAQSDLLSSKGRLSHVSSPENSRDGDDETGADGLQEMGS